MGKAKKKAKQAAIKHTEWIDKSEANAASKATMHQKNAEDAIQDASVKEDEDRLLKAQELKKDWRERTNASGETFFYNKKTGMAVYEKPEGFLSKAEIRELEAEIEATKLRNSV